MNSTSEHVQSELKKLGLDCRVLELPQSTRTAAEAAAAIGCDVAQIAKSLVFRGGSSGKAILIIASGTNRVNEHSLSTLLGEPLEKADANFVKRETGFAIGGVAPLGHTNPLVTLIDEDLLQYSQLWAAAGTPRSVFMLTPAQLQQICAGRVCRIT